MQFLYGSRPGRPRFERVSIIASGQLSVERKLFPNGVYASHLRTPAAEEFELSARLARQGIPAINATQIEAIHDQRHGISDVCDQQYKHGMGCAEAVCKLPEMLIMNELATIEAANGLIRPQDPVATSCKKMVKAFVAILPVRRALVLLCELSGRIVPQPPHECQAAIVRDWRLFLCRLSRRATALRTDGIVKTGVKPRSD